ncbi:SDR family oxidoreductase [Allorhodopirellula solitaria]|uniref:NAD dependent epimerase/dehydratase family protein n=1 Tax=Allorhodopirellula solitaria TaxID=2527987 RepID=A0A5C5YBN7_9BACT|nr:SDR family oxidoreductase [Allorhodopirellula solitaria]TWT73127.1 NAD dependent epimerase/dehydratase family protein [Allorhodopirellula solitaria]
MTKNTIAVPYRRPSLLVVGCGYLGVRVGEQARARGWTVSATTRNRLQTLAQQDFFPLSFDWNDTRDLGTIDRAIREHDIDRVLISVSYDRNSRVGRFDSQVGGLARLLQQIRVTSEQTGRATPDICYISTTGVYHQTGGEWVDEYSTTRPQRDGGRAHLIAEAKLRSCLGERPWTILRLSGIYGPGRVPRAADVRAGRPIASPPQGHLNLIHVDDAASAVIAALSWGDRDDAARRERLYVASDDRPIMRRQFYEEIARQTRSAAPTFLPAAGDGPSRYRSETDKQIWNHRCKRDLVAQWEYPTFVEGLRAIL